MRNLMHKFVNLRQTNKMESMKSLEFIFVTSFKLDSFAMEVRLRYENDNIYVAKANFSAFWQLLASNRKKNFFK